MMKQVGERVRTARALASLTRPELEKRYGIKKTTVAKWENGLAVPSLKSVHQLIHALKTQGIFSTVEWFLHGKGQEAYVVDTPTLLYGNAKNTNTDQELDPDMLVMEEIRNFKNLYPQGVVCLINDDAMLPQFSMGDYVGGLKLAIEKQDSALNKLCIVELKDGRKKLRQVTAGHAPGFYSLCGTNSRAQVYPPVIINVELNWIAPVIWHRLMG